jgi:hypothetical protein
MTKINLSLTTLGRAITALAARAAGRDVHVPYRESKLTRLLQDALGGNARTYLIATLSSSRHNAHESISTLKFADRAKQVMVQATINETRPVDHELVQRLQREVDHLRTMLRQLSDGLGGATSTLGNTGPGSSSHVAAAGGVQNLLLAPSSSIGDTSRGGSPTSTSEYNANMVGNAAGAGPGAMLLSLEMQLNLEREKNLALEKDNEQLKLELARYKSRGHSAISNTNGRQQSASRSRPAPPQPPPGVHFNAVKVKECETAVHVLSGLSEQNTALWSSLEKIQTSMQEFFGFVIEEDVLKDRLKAVFEHLAPLATSNPPAQLEVLTVAAKKLLINLGVDGEKSMTDSVASPTIIPQADNSSNNTGLSNFLDVRASGAAGGISDSDPSVRKTQGPVGLTVNTANVPAFHTVAGGDRGGGGDDRGDTNSDKLSPMGIMSHYERQRSASPVSISMRMRIDENAGSNSNSNVGSPVSSQNSTSPSSGSYSPSVKKHKKHKNIENESSLSQSHGSNDGSRQVVGKSTNHTPLTRPETHTSAMIPSTQMNIPAPPASAGPNPYPVSHQGTGSQDNSPTSKKQQQQHQLLQQQQQQQQVVPTAVTQQSNPQSALQLQQQQHHQQQQQNYTNYDNQYAAAAMAQARGVLGSPGVTMAPSSPSYIRNNPYQNPYGQPSMGQQPMGQPPMGQSHMGQPPMGQMMTNPYDPNSVYAQQHQHLLQQQMQLQLKIQAQQQGIQYQPHPIGMPQQPGLQMQQQATHLNNGLSSVSGVGDDGGGVKKKKVKKVKATEQAPNVGIGSSGYGYQDGAEPLPSIKGKIGAAAAGKENNSNITYMPPSKADVVNVAASKNRGAKSSPYDVDQSQGLPTVPQGNSKSRSSQPARQLTKPQASNSPTKQGAHSGGSGTGLRASVGLSAGSKAPPPLSYRVRNSTETDQQWQAPTSNEDEEEKIQKELKKAKAKMKKQEQLHDWLRSKEDRQVQLQQEQQEQHRRAEAEEAEKEQRRQKRAKKAKKKLLGYHDNISMEKQRIQELMAYGIDPESLMG